VTELQKQLEDIDTYSRALLTEVQLRPGWQDGHPIDECKSPLLRLGIALQIAEGRLVTLTKGGRPPLAGLRDKLSAEVRMALQHFNIEPPAQVFAEALTVILDVAGETLEPETVSRLARRTRKQR
jgi:hypothetical protein